MSSDAKAALRARTVELGKKLLVRTVHEAALIHADLKSGGDFARALELSHKIRGAAATFGFAAISERAAAVEETLKALDAPASAEQQSRLVQLAAALESEAQQASATPVS